MWGHLGLLSHVTNAHALLCGGLGSKRRIPAPPGPLSELKARQVAYSIQQAQEYYKAAGSVTVRTSPLLYFYGMLSLAKALIVANEKATILADVKYHGLMADKSVRSEKLEDQAAVINGGVFQHLCKLIDGDVCPPHAVIYLNDVLSISPELGQMYERLLGKNCRCLNDHNSSVVSKDPYQFQVSVIKTTLQEVFERFPDIRDDFELVPNETSGRIVTLRSRPILTGAPTYFRRYAAPIGGRYLVGALPVLLDGLPSKHYVSPPVSDYIAMFILADCVRYKQDLWGEVVQGRETGILGLIELLIAVSRRRFPSMVLDSLFGEHFDYGSPGRIS